MKVKYFIFGIILLALIGNVSAWSNNTLYNGTSYFTEENLTLFEYNLINSTKGTNTSGFFSGGMCQSFELGYNYIDSIGFKVNDNLGIASNWNFTLYRATDEYASFGYAIGSGLVSVSTLNTYFVNINKVISPLDKYVICIRTASNPVIYYNSSNDYNYGNFSYYDGGWTTTNGDLDFYINGTKAGINRYLIVPQNSVLTNAFINLSGYNNITSPYIKMANETIWGSEVIDVSTNNSESSAGGAGGFSWGLNITSKVNTTIRKITKFSCSTAITANIFSTSGLLLASSPFIENESYFNYEIVNGTSYYILLSGSAGYNVCYSTDTFPMNKTNIIYQNSMQSLNKYTTFPTYVMNIKSITTGNTTVFNQSNNKTNNLINYLNDYLSSCSYIAGYCYVPFSFNSDSNGIIEYLDLIFNNLGFTENSQTFNPTAQSGSSQTFSINLTYDNYAYSGITTYLNYNNTNYSTSTIGTGSNKVFSSTISVSIVSSETNKSFYFIVGLTNSSGTTYVNSNINNQTLTNLAIDNCSVNSLRLLNLSIYDEDLLTSINGTIEALINLYSNSIPVVTYNSTLNYSGTPIGICLNNLTSNYSLSYTLKYYGNSSYFKEYKNIQYMNIYDNFPTQDLRLYDLLYSNGYAFNVIVVGNILSSNGNSGLLVDAQRQYLSQNQFLSVESSLTDSDGIAVVHLVPTSEVYNFIVSYNGVVLGTFNNYQVQCQNPSIGQCSITLNLAQATGSLPDFNNYGNITSSYTLDQTNNILYFTFSSTDGNIKNVTQIVTKNDGYGNTTICTNNAYGTSGTLICNIPTIYQNTSFFSQIFIDEQLVNTQFFSLGQELRDTNLYGVDVLIELLMFSTLVMLFLAHPALIIIGSLLGMFLAIGLIFITGGSWAGIIATLAFFICAGVIVIIRISKKI